MRHVILILRRAALLLSDRSRGCTRFRARQGGASGSGDEEFNAQPGAPREKAGAHAKAGAKGTVGAGSGAPKGTAGAVGDPAATGKRY
jgi:hypothetical protein